MAASVTLAWDPSPDTNVVGYNVYYGTASRTYTQMRNAGNSTSIVITNLTEGATYYFAATAYDSWGLESDYSAETAYTVPFPVLNYPPTLDPVASRALNENAGAQTINLTGISSGSPNEAQTLIVSASSSNPSLIPTPTISYVSPSATGTLTFTPAQYQYGTATISVTVNDGGVTNSTVTRSFQVTVSSVNQQPTLATINDVTVPEDTASITVDLGGISSGAPNEAQTLAVTATSSNTGLILAPTVTYASPGSTGSLTLRPVPTKSGSATITVSVNDGAASNNIISKTFNVIVTPVNDQPTINAIANINLNRNAATQTINLSGISSGATNESQTLVVSAVSSNPTLIPTPQITYSSPAATGTLRFTPSANVGSSVITVTVADGGAENSTTSVSFTVVVNDPPTISDIPHKAIALGSNLPPVAFTIGDLETAASSLVVTASSSSQTLVPNKNIVLGGSGANRTITMTPAPGQIGVVTITVTVSDGIGSASDTFQLAVQQRPVAPSNFHLVIEGLGQVTPNLSGGLVVGQTYTLTATPAADQEFAGWSGSISSSSTSISFVASTNTQLKARFVPSPFVPAKGVYTGLFYESDEVRQESSGYLALQSGSHGKYSGYVLIGAKRLPFSGRFALDCLATNVLRTASGNLTLHLALGGNGQDTVSGDLTDGNWFAKISGDRATFHSVTNKAPWTGSYTLLMPGQAADASLPFGHSYGTMKVAASGSTVVAGRLADGTPFTRTVRMSKNGALPLYVPLYAGSGSVLSWTSMEDRASDDLHGDAHWIRPALASSATYPAGFSVSSQLLGSRYVAPKNGSPIITLASSSISFAVDGKEFSNAIELGTSALVKNIGANPMRMTFVPGSGIFKGLVLDPETGKPASFAGCLLQKQSAGYGWFKLGNSYGTVSLN